MIELPGGTILGPYETREDWLTARRAGIGGSDAAAILGLSSYTDPLSVYYSKIEGDQPEVSEAMEIGAAIEPWILDRWNETRDDVWSTCMIYRDLVIVQSNTLPFLIHSPDALLVDSGQAFAGVEIKNIRSDHNWDPLPEFYMAQVQHGLLCSGLDKWIVVALVGGQKLITREIEPDKEFQGRIALAAERFWVDHVLANVPPEPDGSESASNVLNRRWKASEDEIALIPNYLHGDLVNWTRKLDVAKKGLAKTEQIIKARMGSKEHAMYENGDKGPQWKTSTRTAIDVKRLREVSPEVAKKFEKTTPTRVFRSNL